jgi:hypothetical protein
MSAPLYRRRAALLILASTTLGPAAQSAEDPSDPAAPVPPTQLRSAFADYRPYAEQERPPWQQIMQEVAPAGLPATQPTGHADHPAPGASPPAEDNHVDHSSHH